MILIDIDNLTWEEIEQECVIALLRKYEWRRKPVCIHLKMTSRTLKNKIAKYRKQGIFIPTFYQYEEEKRAQLEHGKLY